AAPYLEATENPVPAMIKAVEAQDNIEVMLGTTIDEINGAPGKFDVKAGGREFKAGAIVVATGFKPYDVSNLGHLGYGKSPDVVGSAQFEEMAKEGKLVRPSDGAPIKKAVFIQCAGSRDPEHLPYCSSTCCMNSLKQANYLLENDGDAQAFIVYKDMRTPSLYEQYYEAAQQSPGIMLTKGEIASVEPNGNGSVKVTATNTLLGDDIEIEADLVVLAQGKVPVMAEDGILNLTYRKGKEVPTLKYGFPDSNFICFPYETARTGIYTVGCVRQPMDIAQCGEDAAGASLKAVQCIHATGGGVAVHPRAGDMSYPEFFLQRCTQCKRCTEECPFGTLDEDEKGTPLENPTRCRRCGICMGACPERIIGFKDYNVDMIGSMIKSVHVPDEFEEKPRYIGLICENDAYPAMDMAGLNHVEYSPLVRFIPVRCLGSVNRVWIADSLSSGIDGLILIGCKYGDDYQCHFLQGSELCNKRMENVQEDLQRLMLESERIKIVQLAINEYDKLPQIVNEFVEEVNNLGPNPYKGF
ncbi:MAG: hydrogenase iron-sulfur subunit, partial [Deltaproteobacteria bacterium]|nr:hydrogenase iron-sulfur subunit [Deltaproteobacteria bacterium]